MTKKPNSKYRFEPSIDVDHVKTAKVGLGPPLFYDNGKLKPEHIRVAEWLLMYLEVGSIHLARMEEKRLRKMLKKLDIS
jgi:hypothetical protein